MLVHVRAHAMKVKSGAFLNNRLTLLIAAHSAGSRLKQHLDGGSFCSGSTPAHWI